MSVNCIFSSSPLLGICYCLLIFNYLPVHNNITANSLFNKSKSTPSCLPHRPSLVRAIHGNLLQQFLVQVAKCRLTNFMELGKAAVDNFCKLVRTRSVHVRFCTPLKTLSMTSLVYFEFLS